MSLKSKDDLMGLCSFHVSEQERKDPAQEKFTIESFFYSLSIRYRLSKARKYF